MLLRVSLHIILPTLLPYIIIQFLINPIQNLQRQLCNLRPDLLRRQRRLLRLPRLVNPRRDRHRRNHHADPDRDPSHAPTIPPRLSNPAYRNTTSPSGASCPFSIRFTFSSEIPNALANWACVSCCPFRNLTHLARNWISCFSVHATPRTSKLTSLILL